MRGYQHHSLPSGRVLEGKFFLTIKTNKCLIKGELTMAEDYVNVTNDGEQMFDTNKMYLEQIENLKKNTVSKDDYQKLLNDNRNLLDTIVNG